MKRRPTAGAAIVTGLAVAAALFSTAPAQAVDVDWTPRPGGMEVLRFTGNGLAAYTPTDPRFAGQTFSFTAGRGFSEGRRVFTISPGQDVPKHRLALVGETLTRSQLQTSRGLVTTTAMTTDGLGTGTRLHLITGGQSVVLASFEGEVVHVTGQTGNLLHLVSAYDQWIYDFETANLTSVGVSQSGFLSSRGFHVSTDLSATTHRWGRYTPDGAYQLVVNTTDGVSGAGGLGRLREGMPFNDGAIVSATHTVHGNELWFLPGDDSLPQLVTNVNDAGGTARVNLLGVRDGRMWFRASAPVSKVFSTAGEFGDTRVEMSDPSPSASISIPATLSNGITAVDYPYGLYGYRPGLAQPELLVPHVARQAVAQDGRTLFVTTANNFQHGYFTTDGTMAGTKPLDVYRPVGHSLLSNSVPALTPGPNRVLGYQLFGQGQLQQFLQRPDRTVRLLKVTAPATQRQTRRAIRVKVTAGAGEKVTTTVRGSIRIPGRRAISFATKRITTAKDRTGTLTLTLPKAKRAVVLTALRKKRTVRAVLTLTIRDANAGNTVTRTVRVRLR